MCRIMEDMKKEAKLEERLEMATKILESGEMAESRVKELFNLTEKQMKAIKERIAVLA